MSIEKVITGNNESVIIRVHASPSKKHTRVPTGIDPWRNLIKVSLSAKPENSAANKELLEEFAKLFKEKARESIKIEIISGHTSRLKTIRINGISVNEARETMRKALK